MAPAVGRRREGLSPARVGPSQRGSRRIPVICQIGKPSQQRAGSLPELRASTAPSPTWQFCFDAVPHTVPGTNAGPISCQSRRSSTPRLRPGQSERRRAVCFCARVPQQVIVCRCCDRGQIYCAAECARQARQESQRAAAQRYQASLSWPARAAERSRRYRARQKIVTHQGSPAPPADDLLPAGAMATRRDDGFPGRAAPAVGFALPLVRPSLPAAASPGVPAPSRSPSRPCWTRPDGAQRPMVTPPDIEAQILRYYHAEKWTIGTIARQLHVHHSVVQRVLAQAGLPRLGPPPRPSQVDAICRSSARRWRSSRS